VITDNPWIFLRKDQIIGYQAADFQSAGHQLKLRESVSVPDEYITFRRALGIYPLTRWFVSCGVSRWHTEARKSFSPERPVNWRTIRYVSAEKIDLSLAHQIVVYTKRDALGLPKYSPKELKGSFMENRLFTRRCITADATIRHTPQPECKFVQS